MWVGVIVQCQFCPSKARHSDRCVHSDYLGLHLTGVLCVVPCSCEILAKSGMVAKYLLVMQDIGRCSGSLVSSAQLHLAQVQPE